MKIFWQAFSEPPKKDRFIERDEFFFDSNKLSVIIDLVG